MARVIHLIRMCPLSSATFHMSEGRWARPAPTTSTAPTASRSEEHTSELQSLTNLVCRLLLEKKNKNSDPISIPSPRSTNSIEEFQGCIRTRLLPALLHAPATHHGPTTDSFGQHTTRN